MDALEIIRFLSCACCTVIGLVAIVSAVFGVFRFRHALNRIHAAALVDTAGMLFMQLGVIIAVGFNVTALKLAVVICFLWITSPVSSHLVARLEVTTNDELSQQLQVDAPEMIEREKGGA